MSFLFLLAAATFRLEGASHPISLNMTGVDTTAVMTLSGDDDVNSQMNYVESVENVIKSTFRPANILMTNVQICLMFWIFGSRVLAFFVRVCNGLVSCSSTCTLSLICHTLHMLFLLLASTALVIIIAHRL